MDQTSAIERERTREGLSPAGWNRLVGSNGTGRRTPQRNGSAGEGGGKKTQVVADRLDVRWPVGNPSGEFDQTIEERPETMTRKFNLGAAELGLCVSFVGKMHVQ